MGLLGRILLILLATVVVEFGASTLLYERASQYSIQADEANRLAEHLVISRKLIAERPFAQREAAGREMVTDRYDITWTPRQPEQTTYPRLPSMERQILEWEPSLRGANLKVHLAPLSQGSVAIGELKMAEGGWIQFRMRGIKHGWSLAFERVLIALLPATVLLLLSALLIRVTLRPLRALIRAIGQVGSGHRVPIREEGAAEVRGLIHAFNMMQDRIHELIESRTQALAAVGHDLRTPIARLQLRLEGIRDDDARSAMIGDIEEMEGMIASLLTFVGGEDDPEQPIQTDVAVMVETLVDGAVDRGREATYSGPEHLEMVVRVSLLRRAVSNLIENALHYGERVDVRVAQERHWVTITVDDDGPGIAPEKIEAAMRPFVRLDEARGRNTSGMGLGLAIVSQAVTRENGRLTLENRDAGGLRARIWLPR